MKTLLDSQSLSPNSLYPRLWYRFSIGIFFFLQGSVFATWTSRIPDIKQALDLSDGQLGSVLFCFPLGQLLCVPLAGYLVEKLKSRALLLSAALLYPFVLMGIGMVNSIWMLGFILFFMGLLANIHNLAVNTQAVGVEKMYSRSIMATFHGLWSLAGFTAGLVASFLVSKNIDPLFHFAGVFIFGVLVVVFLNRLTLKKDISEDNDSAAPTFNIFKGMNSFVLFLGLLAFGSMLSEGCIYDWGSVYFDQVLGIEPQYIRFGYTGCMLAMAMMRFLADGVVNKMGAVRVVRISGFVSAIGFFIAVLCPFVFADPTTRLWIATIGYILVGIGVSSVVPICYGMASRNGSMSAGRAINAVSTIGFFGFVAGPPVIGHISQAIGMPLAFTLIACIGLLTALLAGKLKAL